VLQDHEPTFIHGRRALFHSLAQCAQTRSIGSGAV
jgi:hypothetical protein